MQQQVGLLTQHMVPYKLDGIVDNTLYRTHQMVHYKTDGTSEGLSHHHDARVRVAILTFRSYEVTSS
jgi:hypothetical protein